MNSDKRIASFADAGKELAHFIAGPQGEECIRLAGIENPWFTAGFVLKAVSAWVDLLDRQKLTDWLAPYSTRIDHAGTPKTIGVVMAGNIPMAGFHDMLSVLLSGNRLLAKLSSQDRQLLPAIASLLVAIDPGWKPMISFTEGRLSGFDAMIATGSNNSSRYFEYYFGRVPNIIRKNRNSVAILTGDESDTELEAMADDLFLYFGRGCRSVSKLFLPDGYDLEQLIRPFNRYNGFYNHHKYRNNYDYNKSILLLNKTSFFDGGFYLMVPSSTALSPVSVIHYEYYEEILQVNAMLEKEKEGLQCVVGRNAGNSGRIPFGKAQFPGLSDYADGIDTLDFLAEKIR